MNSLAMVDSLVPATVASEAVAGERTSSRSVERESKRAFADSPPLAKIRKEQAQQKESSEVSPEVELEGDYEPQALAEAPQSDAKELPVEGESGADSGNAVVDLATAATAEGAAEKVDLTVEGSAVESGIDPATVVAEASPVATDAMSADAAQTAPGGPQVEAVADALPQEAVNAEAVVVTSEVSQRSPGEGTDDSQGSAIPVAAGQSVETAAKEAEVIAPATTGGDQNASVATSESGVAAKGQTAELTDPEATEALSARSTPAGPDVAGTPIDQEASGEKSGSGNLDHQAQAAVIPQREGTDVAKAHDDGQPTPTQQETASLPDGKAATEGMADQIKTGTSSEFEMVAKASTEPSVEMPGNVSMPESVSAAPENAPAAETSALKSPAQNVGEQILDSVHASLSRGDSQVTVRLDPPELGSVVIRFQEQDGQLTGVLEISKEQTRQEVEETLPQVVRSLQEAGVLVRRLDVVTSDASERDVARDALPQDAWDQRDGSGENEAQSGHSTAGGRDAWAGKQQAFFDQNDTRWSQGAAARGGIDMLI